MSSTTPNLGLTKTTAAETIGQNWAASNDSGGNFDIIDTKMGAVGNTSVQAQLDTLNSKTTPLYKEISGSTTAVSPSTWATLAQITLPAGTWLINGEVDYSLNQSGIRVLMITYSATDTQNKPENSVLATGRAVLSRVRILRSSEQTTVYLRAYHTSGETINCIGNMRCVRLNTEWTTN